MMPALLITMSRCPNCSTAPSTSACAPADRGHVVGVGDGGTARGDDLAGDGRGRFGVCSDAVHRPAEVVDDDPGAPFGEQQRIGAADAAPRAGDDRDAPLETELAQAATEASNTHASGWPPEERAANVKTAGTKVL